MTRADKRALIERIAEMRAAGSSLSEIGRAVGLTKQRVHQLCGIHHIVAPEPQPKPIKETKKRADRLGMTRAEKRAIVAECLARGLRDPYVAFRWQISGAKKRDIEFKMTFREWWDLWSPHFDKRGTRKGQLVMCRELDKGAYEVGNVRIDYSSSNSHDRRYNRKATRGSAADNKRSDRQVFPDSSSSIWDLIPSE
jgi:hypothetical protein